MFNEHSTNQAQEPRITAYVSKDEKMIKSFQEGKDIYSAIASIAFNVPYEECCEFHPVTGEHQAEGKHRRGEAKTIVLGRPKGFVLNKTNAPSTGIYFHRLLSENIVNYITHRCVSYV